MYYNATLIFSIQGWSGAHTPDYKCFINTCQLHLIHSDLMQYCTIYYICAWPHSGSPCKSRPQMTPRFAEGCCENQCSSHVSAAFQAAFPLVTDSGPFRSMGTWIKRWSDLFCLCDTSTLSWCTLPAFLFWTDLSGLTLACCSKKPQKNHMALWSQLTPYDRAVIALPQIPSHTPPTYAHFSFLSLLWQMKHWCLRLWFSCETNRDRLN